MQEARFAMNNSATYACDQGMLNDKLFALRWVMGDEWDMLDT